MIFIAFLLLFFAVFIIISRYVCSIITSFSPSYFSVNRTQIWCLYRQSYRDLPSVNPGPHSRYRAAQVYSSHLNWDGRFTRIRYLVRSSTTWCLCKSKHTASLWINLIWCRVRATVRLFNDAMQITKIQLFGTRWQIGYKWHIGKFSVLIHFSFIALVCHLNYMYRALITIGRWG
jgi:hypothetical protein